MTDTKAAPAAVPAAKPAAVANLQTMMAELSSTEQQDLALANEVDQVRSDAAAATLNDAERQKAAAAGAVMGFAFMETLLNGGLELGGIDTGTKDAVKKVIDNGRKDVTASLEPLLLKYRAEPPAAVAKFKEELLFAFRFLMMAFAIFVAFKKGQAAAALAKKPAPANDEQAAAA